ncbi:response regulator [Salinispirillum marinum]|uniref:Response regulator n=2 Tax=Saccharospirillaceae TaxID=255527 RepID=A0ABV8BH32_9GAMM
MAHILIVEDEPKLAQVLSDYLRRDGFDTHICGDGADVMPWLAEHATDLVILDLMLPNIDGMTLCRQIRQQHQPHSRTLHQTPIIMTTARVEEIDRLLGLELGADDYVCKPYSPREIVARVKAVLRRTALTAEVSTAPFSLDLVVEPNHNLLRVGERRVELTAVEMRLLQVMVGSPGRIFTREQLMDQAYPDRRLVNDRTIDSHIKNLRRKLNALNAEHQYVRSVYGAGYKYEPTP